MESLLVCAQTKRPDNTIFADVNSVSVGYSDMENYIELILGLFQVSPEGCLALYITLILACTSCTYTTPKDMAGPKVIYHFPTFKTYLPKWTWTAKTT